MYLSFLDMPSYAAVGCQNRMEDPNRTTSWKYLPTRNIRQKELWLTYIMEVLTYKKYTSKRIMADIYHGSTYLQEIYVKKNYG